MTVLDQQLTDRIVIGKNSGNPLEVYRLGYGTMRLTGPEIWGEPADRNEAIRILRAAVDNGVNYIDTADYYGPFVTNRLIREALYPYSADLVIGTKIGAKRLDDKSWVAFASPENLRQSVEDNLRNLQLEQLSVVHFRRMLHKNPVSFEESIEAMFELQREGKILHVGLSNVSVEELNLTLTKGAVATIQNLYSYTKRATFNGAMGETRGGEEVLGICEENCIPLIPYFSLITSLPAAENKIQAIAEKYGVSKAQVNLSWLLHKSEWIMPIPGTSSLTHLEENLSAIKLRLTQEDMDLLG